MFRGNKNLLVIALVAIVNALGYGIVIPVLYSYSHKFGLTDFQNGLLFSIFSVCQFIATPIIGRLSDLYGRRPMLIVSILGTAVSFFLMAWAPSAFFLFLARALDGITAGNLPVASAVISDTTTPENRAKGFGIIGASFGFGFVFGPAISALTVGWGPSVPFLIAAVVSLAAVIITFFALPETNKHKGLVRQEKIFDFKPLLTALKDENVGLTLMVSFVYSFAFSVFIYGYQPVSVELLKLSTTLISVNFTIIGIVGLVAQVAIIPKVMRRFGEREMLRNALVLETVVLFGFFLTRSFVMLVAVSILHALANAFINPLLGALLSKEVEEHSQGTIQGINASYVSLGMIIGPIVGGILATWLLPLPFLAASVMTAVCALLCMQILRRHAMKKVAI